MFERLPSPADLLARPITSGLALAAIMTTVVATTGASIEPLVMTRDAIGPEPWRLLTSALPHIGVFHLVFNVYWLLVIGGAIEARAGVRVIVPLVLATAIGSAALEHALFAGGVGLSGVGYGLFGFARAANRRDPTFRDVVDDRTAQLFVVWFFVCCAMTATGVMAVANAAHAGGWLVGMLAGIAWAGREQRVLAAIGALVTVLVSVAIASPALRASVNVSGVEQELAHDAYALIEAEPSRAIALYEDAIARDPSVAQWHHSLGVALERAGRDDDALRSFERAYELDTGHELPPDALAIMLARQARDALEAERWDDAVTPLRRAIELVPEHDDAPAWRRALEHATARRDAAAR